jgi:hypothetical protein
MKWVILVLVIIAAVGVLVYLVGHWLPVKHAASIEYSFSKTSPQELWNAITSFKQYSTWRSGLKNVVVLDDKTWTETNGHGDTIHYGGEVSEPGRRFISRILNKDLPYGGSWTYEIIPIQADRTLLKITEHGEVYNPIFRFMSRYFFGHDATLKQYMADLRNQLDRK